jgi:alkylation response protein AidB-like acyl-CoA dehydrogenase
MQFGLTETQQMLKNSARDFFPTECPMAEVRRLMELDGAYDAELWQKIADQGWTGVIFPEEHGGMGMGLVEMAVAAEEMGRALLPGPFFSTVFVAGALLDAMPQWRHRIARIAQGEERATLALLEDDTRWDPDGVRLRLSGGRISGRKLFVSDAASADFLLCAARCGEELAIVQIDPRGRGVSIRPMPALDRTRQLYSIEFDRAAVEILATGVDAEAALERAGDIACIALAAEMAGAMQRVLEITVEYAKTRKQFGKPIGQFQAVQHLCADMLVLTESSRSAACYAAWALQEGAPGARTAVSIAKAYASDACREVINRGIQVHGGMGFTWENDLHLYYRRAKASEIAFGDAAFHREHIARSIVDARAAHAVGAPTNM